MKLFMFFIHSILWLWIFIIPAGILSFAGFWIYLSKKENLPYAVFMSIAGIFLGALLAEFIRKKYGLSDFFGRISATPDIDGNNILDPEFDEHRNNG